MPTFKYKVQDTTGALEEGEVVSKDRYVLAQDLRKEGKTIISVEEVKLGEIDISKYLSFLARVSLQEKILFTRNLSAMIEAGLPIARALGVLERQSKNPKFKEVLRGISADITKGTPLSDSLEKSPKIFSGLMVSMVRVGEETGKLAQSLSVIGEQLEKSYTLRKKIKGAMMYPTIVISVMIVIGILMMMYVVPTLTETFKDMDVELPMSTQIVILISDTLAAHSLLVLFGMIFFIVGLVLFGRTTSGQHTFDFIALNFPVIGTIAKEYNTAMTARTLASLLSSGVNVVEALSITEGVIQNHYYRDVLQAAGEQVQKGSNISQAFTEHEKLYPPLAAEMTEVGEETGQLAGMLSRVADFYESEVDTKTKDLTTIIEPVLMVVIGAAVGFFALSMITPMYSLTSTL